MKLKDKTAIVTGAASGIGKEIATVFAGEGAKVAIADLALAAAAATVEELRRTGATAMAVEMDVTDESQVLIITSGGKLIRVEASGIRVIGRSTQGVRLIDTSDGDSVSSASLIERQQVAIEENGAES